MTDTFYPGRGDCWLCGVECGRGGGSKTGTRDSAGTCRMVDLLEFERRTGGGGSGCKFSERTLRTGEGTVKTGGHGTVHSLKRQDTS